MLTVEASYEIPACALLPKSNTWRLRAEQRTSHWTNLMRCYFSGPLSGKAATEDGSPRIHFDWSRLRARMKSSVTRAAVSTPAALYNAATK